VYDFVLNNKAMTLANKDGDTLLHFAAAHGTAPMIRRLINQGEDVNYKNNAGKTPLDISEEKGNNEAFMALTQHGGKRSIELQG
jgi:ankyrin repeat protein